MLLPQAALIRSARLLEATAAMIQAGDGVRRWRCRTKTPEVERLGADDDAGQKIIEKGGGAVFA